MKFSSNECVAIHVDDLGKAERFYSDVLGFSLIGKTAKQLEYNTGHFLLSVNKGTKIEHPIPSFSVRNVADAKTLLKKNGCSITDDRGSSFYFTDPFGLTYDVVKISDDPGI